jgi:hypothetical protein
MTALTRYLAVFAIAAAVMAALSGCGSVNEQTWAATATSPGKFGIYTCDEIEPLISAYRARINELEQLMSRASQGAGGEFVNTIAYRSEYTQTRGFMAELEKAKIDRQCAANSKFSSGRAVF